MQSSEDEIICLTDVTAAPNPDPDEIVGYVKVNSMGGKSKRAKRSRLNELAANSIIKLLPFGRFPANGHQYSFLVVDLVNKVVYGYFAFPGCQRWINCYGHCFACLELQPGWSKGALVQRTAPTNSCDELYPTTRMMTSDSDQRMFTFTAKASSLLSASVDVCFDAGAPAAMRNAAAPLAALLRKRGFNDASKSNVKGEVAQIASCLGAKDAPVETALTDDVKVITGSHEKLVGWLEQGH